MISRKKAYRGKRWGKSDGQGDERIKNGQNSFLQCLSRGKRETEYIEKSDVQANSLYHIFVKKLIVFWKK